MNFEKFIVFFIILRLRVTNKLLGEFRRNQLTINNFWEKTGKFQLDKSSCHPIRLDFLRKLSMRGFRWLLIYMRRLQTLIEQSEPPARYWWQYGASTKHLQCIVHRHVHPRLGGQLKAIGGRPGGPCQRSLDDILIRCCPGRRGSAFGQILSRQQR